MNPSAFDEGSAKFQLSSCQASFSEQNCRSKLHGCQSVCFGAEFGSKYFQRKPVGPPVRPPQVP